MDILNFISWTKNGRTVSTVDGANTLVPLGFKDPKRDDGYLAGAISVTDFLALSPSVIAVNGTSLYSTNPAAGPVGPLDNIAFGLEAGSNATTAEISNFIGFNAGKNSSGAANNFIGRMAGENATNSSQSNFIGNTAGKLTNNAYWSNFIGGSAGQGASNAYSSNFIGYFAGNESSGTFRSNFFGQEAGAQSTGNNVNAFGYQAHRTGTLSGQTVFSNTSFASYTNRAAATTAITVPNGARAGGTYLYYNQTTFAIEGVRL
jgi:hypothetical protein